MEEFDKKIRGKILGDISQLDSIMIEKGISSEFFEKLNYFKDFVNEISNEKKINRIIKISNEINSINAIKDNISIQQILIRLNLLFDEIEEEEEDEKFSPINERFKELYITQEKEKGISLLCKHLDELTGGLHKGKICTIVGGPGSMKTTYATNICYEAIKNGKNVCFLSLEETPMDIYSKLLSRASIDLNKGITVQDITQHKLVENEEKLLMEDVHPYLENLKGTFYLLGESDLGDLSHITIERQLKSIDEKIKLKSVEKQNGENHGIDIVVLDYIQILKHANSKIKDEYMVINSYMSFFRKNSKNFLNQDREVLVLILSQANREGLSYAKKHAGEYLINHVAEASEIERASSYIISVYTDATMQMSKILKIGAIKLRGSALPLSTINVFADGQFYQVGDIKEHKELNYSIDDIEYKDMNIKDLNNTSDSLESILGSIAL